MGSVFAIGGPLGWRQRRARAGAGLVDGGRDGVELGGVELEAGGFDPAVDLGGRASADDGAGYTRPGERPGDGDGADAGLALLGERKQRLGQRQVPLQTITAELVG